MSLLDDFRRVSRQHPCPICGKHDWCLISRDDPSNPSSVICQRIESKTRCGDAGWLHILRDTEWMPARRRSIRLTSLPRRSDLPKLAGHYCRLATDEYVQHVADELGLTRRNLRRLEIGRTSNSESVFPMRRPDGLVLGIRRRLRNGKKLAVRGSRDGLFLPDGIPDQLSTHAPLLIAEGPTDTAALLDLGFFVVGRPSCTGGTALLRDFVVRRSVTSVVIVADRDAAGSKGATRLGQALRPLCRSVKIILPPVGINDARAWKAAGATHEDLAQVIDSTSSLDLRLSVCGGSS